MTRYIDADALYASIAKETYLLTYESNSRDYGMYLIGIKKKIDEAPTADVVSREEYRRLLDAMVRVDDALREYQDKEENGDFVKVVRCKECKWYESDGGAMMVCTLFDWYASDGNDYCSHGERRE